MPTKRATTKKKNHVPKPLTIKRKHAIYQYMEHISEEHYFSIPTMVDEVIRAERMDGDKLYRWLQLRGYRWRKNQWVRI